MLLGGLNELMHMDQCLTHSQCSINTSYYYYYTTTTISSIIATTDRILKKKFQQWYLSIAPSLSILALTTSGILPLLVCLPQLYRKSNTSD